MTGRFLESSQDARGALGGCERKEVGCWGPCRGVRKPVYAYCRNDFKDSATSKRTVVWGGCGYAGQDARGRARACAVQKQKPGRKRLLCVVSGPIFLGCYSDMLRRCGDFWTEDEGFFAATVTRAHPETIILLL